jgi:hypothetical protein
VVPALCWHCQFPRSVIPATAVIQSSIDWVATLAGMTFLWDGL